MKTTLRILKAIGMTLFQLVCCLLAIALADVILEHVTLFAGVVVTLATIGCLYVWVRINYEDIVWKEEGSTEDKEDDEWPRDGHFA